MPSKLIKILRPANIGKQLRAPQAIKLVRKHHWLIAAVCGILIIGGIYLVYATVHRNNFHSASITTAGSIQHSAKSESATAKKDSKHNRDTKSSGSTSPKSTTSTPNDKNQTSTSNSVTLPSQSIVDERGPQPAPDPKPNFRLELLPSPPGGGFGFILKATEMVQPSEITQFSTPEVLFGSEGAPRCSGSIYYINSNDSWGFSCNMYSDAIYGRWPVTFKVTAMNIYNQSSTKSVRGLIVYRANQTEYENILSY